MGAVPALSSDDLTHHVGDPLKLMVYPQDYAHDVCNPHARGARKGESHIARANALMVLN